MACNNCMDYKRRAINQFTCPECGQIWVEAGVWPGRYWEPLEKYKEEKEVARKLILEAKNA